ncbi:MAG: radical SAM protein [Flavobacteriales bacterium]|nr:radical SAM protein [Flavobacteriales bacterium]
MWKILETIQGLLYAKNYLFYYKWGWIKNSTTTKEINIEFSSACNLRCAFCSLDHLKPKILLKPEVLEKFMKNLIEDHRFRGVEYIHLHNGGETLLHNQIGEMLGVLNKYKRLAKEKSQKFPVVTLLTNGTPLNKKKTKEIIESEAIDIIRFSMDGGGEERFEEVRIRAKWNLFFKNISYFLEENKKLNQPIKTHIISVLDPGKPLNTKWMSPVFQDIYNKIDTYELRHPHTWAGEVEIDGDSTNHRKKPHKIGCGQLMHQLVLLPNGDINVCCTDLNSRGVMGNIKDSSLFDIYFSPKRKKWLELLFLGRKKEIDLCKNCETF